MQSSSIEEDLKNDVILSSFKVYLRYLSQDQEDYKKN